VLYCFGIYKECLSEIMCVQAESVWRMPMLLQAA